MDGETKKLKGKLLKGMLIFESERIRTQKQLYKRIILIINKHK